MTSVLSFRAGHQMIEVRGTNRTQRVPWCFTLILLYSFISPSYIVAANECNKQIKQMQ